MAKDVSAGEVFLYDMMSLETVYEVDRNLRDSNPVVQVSFYHPLERHLARSELFCVLLSFFVVDNGVFGTRVGCGNFGRDFSTSLQIGNITVI